MVNKMNLYYQNETLFIDVNGILDEEHMKYLKRKIFRIVDDYDINHIILRSYPNNLEYKKMFQQIKKEYNQKYTGYFVIR